VHRGSDVVRLLMAGAQVTQVVAACCAMAPSGWPAWSRSWATGWRSTAMARPGTWWAAWPRRAAPIRRPTNGPNTCGACTAWPRPQGAPALASPGPWRQRGHREPRGTAAPSASGQAGCPERPHRPIRPGPGGRSGGRVGRHRHPPLDPDGGLRRPDPRDCALGARPAAAPGLRLLHGPGCPVCVTPAATIDQALALALRPEVILCSYGDMLRVPGTAMASAMTSAMTSGRTNGMAHGAWRGAGGAGDQSLLGARAGGGDVRLLTSPCRPWPWPRPNPTARWCSWRWALKPPPRPRPCWPTRPWAWD
jgi:hypothetical protein